MISSEGIHPKKREVYQINLPAIFDLSMIKPLTSGSALTSVAPRSETSEETCIFSMTSSLFVCQYYLEDGMKTGP